MNVEFKSDSSVRRVFKNGFFQAVNFGIYTLTGLLFVPFLIHQYGSGGYGLIALAGFLTQYVSFISGCIGSSVARFINISLNENDNRKANEIFSTALVTNIGIIIIQLPIYALGIWKLNWLIDFSPNISSDLKILVVCNVVVFLISIISGFFQIPIQAANRIDLYSKINFVKQTLRLILLFSLICSVGAKLWIIGTVDLFLAVLSFAAIYFISRNLAKDLVFRRKDITYKWVKPVLNMAGWSIIAGLGQILFQKTDVWIVNRFVSIEQAGICAALLIGPNFLQQIAKQMSSLLMPVFMIDYAHTRIERIRDITVFMSKFFSIISLISLGFIIIFGEWMLGVWLGSEYRKYNLFLILMIIHFPLTLSREAIWLIFPTFNKMHLMGVSNIISGILNIILSLLAVFFGFGLTGVIVATGISLILQRTVFLSFFGAKLLGIKYVDFLKIYAAGFLVIFFFFVQSVIFPQSNFLWTGVLSLFFGIGSLINLFLHDLTFKTILNRLGKIV